ISEAMYALGVPTTRSLAVVATDEVVYRDRPASGAVLTRVASSHIRVGTFQYAAMQGDDVLKALADYTIQRHDADLKDSANPYLGLLNRVIERQAALIAQWMLLGFVHGVMNTDNVSIAGETIDYGPCAFMDVYDPATVFSSIDRQGRYAYGNQPAIGHWNLCRFAESLMPLLDADEHKALELAQAAINTYAGHYDTAWRNGLASKLGFSQRSEEIDQLGEDFLQHLQTSGADFTNSFRALMQPETLDPSFKPWLERWNNLVKQQSGGKTAAIELMAKTNPVVIPRNHLVQAALDAAEQGDDQPFESFYAVLQTPFDLKHQGSIYTQPPPADASPYVTYCGT
ncbi:MAG: protein adenylyltransferase SelO, partial [Fluviibacter sp.]